MVDLSEDYMNSCTVDELAEHIGKGLVPSCLTFAAEILGRRDTAKKYAAMLRTLLKHPSAVVREGAIYGLCAYNDDVVTRAIAELATADSDPGVRLAAKEAIESLAVDDLLNTVPESPPRM